MKGRSGRKSADAKSAYLRGQNRYQEPVTIFYFRLVFLACRMIADSVTRFCEPTLNPTTKGISWKVSRTAGIPQNRKSLASGSAYRGSNPWGAAKLDSSTYELRNAAIKMRKTPDIVFIYFLLSIASGAQALRSTVLDRT